MMDILTYLLQLVLALALAPLVPGIINRVKAKFAEDPTVSAMSISVETLKGTVQLSGFAKNAVERSRAGELAKERQLMSLLGFPRQTKQLLLTTSLKIRESVSSKQHITVPQQC